VRGTRVRRDPADIPSRRRQIAATLAFVALTLLTVSSASARVDAPAAGVRASTPHAASAGTGRNPRNVHVVTQPGPADGASGSASALASWPAYAFISNGTLRLGVNPEGHLDATSGTEDLGIEYVPTSGDALIPGCWCEGWGIADRTANASGWASVDNGGISANVVVTSFDVTATTAESVVEVDGRWRVRHFYHPSPRPELYEVDLTVENIGAASSSLVYRRAMDWDVPPTEFDEFVTLQGSLPFLLDSTDDGFAYVDPLLPLTDLGARGTFQDVGPDDRGGAFDLSLGTLAPGASSTLTMFYGAAATEADALTALAAVRADVYSLGEPNTPGGPTFGTPNTFMFGITGEGVPTPEQPPEQSYGTCDGTGAHAVTPSGCLSDPVNTLTGAFTTSVEDLSLPGTGVAFAWRRSYTSADPTVGRLGPGWTDGYAASLTVLGNGDVRLHGDEGQQVLFTRQADGAFAGGAGARSELSEVVGGYRLVRHDQAAYRFDSSGRLLELKDRNGAGLTFGYDGSGRLTSVTDAASRQSTLTYDPSGLLSTVSAPDGRSVAYGYTAGRLTSVTDVRGKTWTYGYDPSGRLTIVIDPLGHTQLTNVYGADGRVQEQTDALGKTTRFAWDVATQTATITDPNDNVWKDVYAGNVLVSRIDPLDEATAFEHDLDLNTTAVTGPDGNRTTIAYDASGNPTTATAPTSLNSVQKSFTYNGRNDVTSITDARGTLTEYGYDGTGNGTMLTQDGAPVGEYAYDAQGRVTSYTDGNDHITTYGYDATGNLTSLTDPLGNKTTYTYDAARRVLTRIEPRGNAVGANPANFTWTYTYNAAGQVLTETDPLGNRTRHTYDDAGNELTLTDANGRVTTYEYDDANRLKKVVAPDLGTTTYTYDDVGNRLTETDPLGHTTTYTYDSANRLTSVTTASGARTTHFYDETGNLIKTVAPRGNVAGANPDDFATTYTYDAAGRLLTETDPLGDVTTHVYDAVGNEEAVTDPNDSTTTYTYDGQNRLATATAPDDGVTTYTYDLAGNRLTEKDPLDHTTTYTYDAASRLTAVTTATGAKTTNRYDENGNLVAAVEPRGNVAGANPADYTTSYAYDRADRRTSVTDPLGDQTTLTYDAVGNRLSSRDANGHTTAFGYDAFNRLRTITAPDLGVTTYTYDAAGNLTSRTDAKGHVTTYAYGPDNRRTGVTSPTGQRWSTAYDPDGNVTVTIDANGNATPASGDGTTSFAYDRAGQLNAIDYSDSTPDVSLAYDPAGNRIQMTDGAGTEVRTYDVVGRLETVTRAGDTFAYGYDLAGQVTSRTYPAAPALDYGYDADGRLVSVAGGGQTTSLDYDAAGNLTRVTPPAANGYSESRTYDRAGRLTEVRHARASAAFADERLSPNGLLEQTQMKGALSTLTTPCAEAAGTQGVEPQRPPDNGGAGGVPCWMIGNSAGSDPSVRVGYPTPTLAPDGVQTFEARIRKFGGSSTPTARIDLYENGVLRAQGATIPVTSTTGQTVTQTFDVTAIALQSPSGVNVEARFVGIHSGSGQTRATVDLEYLDWTARTTVSPQLLARSTLTLDPVGNPTQVVTEAETVRYAYDATDRLTEACYKTSACTGASDPFIRWTYDKVANRLTEQRPAGTTSYAYNVADQLTQRSGLGGTVAYSYDPNGNQTAAGARQFAYDLANRVRSTTSGTTTTTYAYDGDGNRLETRVGTQATRYLWDVNGALPELALERDGTGALLRRYTFGGGLRSLTTSAGTYTYHRDFLGSVVGLTSSSGARQWTYSYEPFGSARSTQQQTPAAPANVARFTGAQLDPTGLYHLRAREYDPTLGRFLTLDPVEAPASVPYGVPYVYVGDRPTVLVDPSGLFSSPPDSRAPASVASSAVRGKGMIREAWYAIPRWRHLGILYGGLFIQRAKLCPVGVNVPYFFQCLTGDARSFSPYAGRDRYRMYMGLDFFAGLSYFRINPTCIAGGECFQPHEIEHSRPWWDPRDFPDRANKIDKRVTDDYIRFSWKLVNAAQNLPQIHVRFFGSILPEINGSMTVKRKGDVELDLDGFPSFELYHRFAPGGTPNCVYQFGETNPLALVLPAFIPGFDEGRSHC
jgi:RHS repeat-associated protein